MTSTQCPGDGPVRAGGVGLRVRARPEDQSTPLFLEAALIAGGLKTEVTGVGLLRGEPHLRLWAAAAMTHTHDKTPARPSLLTVHLRTTGRLSTCQTAADEGLSKPSQLTGQPVTVNSNASVDLTAEVAHVLKYSMAFGPYLITINGRQSEAALTGHISLIQLGQRQAWAHVYARAGGS